ncbi:MAG: iron-containing redox enzyme family protein [Solirubrobacteraceae bacterium]
MLADRCVGERVIAIPPVRGRWTEALCGLLRGEGEQRVVGVAGGGGEVLEDDDLQLALYLCYELHYSGLVGVDARMEWSPLVLRLRSALEARFEAALRELVVLGCERRGSVGAEIQRLVRADSGPGLSRYAEREATREQLLEHVVHRSAYQLKEADPHSWAIPRLVGRPKAALVEVQADEYGAGRPERIHAVLFANTMAGLGLDARYGAYLHHLPAITLATVNLMSWFGLHRRLRGCLVGHLAAFEMTSSIPNRRYANAFRRVGYGPAVTDFYDEHVTADAVHESIAAWDLADALAQDQPQLTDDILFGAQALLTLEARWATHLLTCWQQGHTSLTSPLHQTPTPAPL